MTDTKKIDFSSQVLIPEHILSKELDGEAVLLDTKTQNYFGLDVVGTRIWQALSSATSIQDAFQQLEKEYEVTAEQLQSDIEAFISKLLSKEMIIIEKNP